MLTFGQVESPWWDDAPAFLIGSGPSLRGFDFSRLNGAHVIGINHSIGECCTEVGFAIDRAEVEAAIAPWTDFAKSHQLYLAVDHSDWRPIPDAIYLECEDGIGISTDPRRIRRGGIGGYGALNLAVLKEAKKIVMLGYDAGSPNSDRHHYYDTEPNPQPGWDAGHAVIARRFDDMNPTLANLGVEVVNASLYSSIGAFKKMSIDRALEWSGR